MFSLNKDKIEICRICAITKIFSEKCASFYQFCEKSKLKKGSPKKGGEINYAGKGSKIEFIKGRP